MWETKNPDSWENLVGAHGAARFSKFWPYFRPRNAIFYTRFQTAPLKSRPVFRPGLQEIRSSLLSRKNTKRKDLQKIYFEFAYYSFFLIHLELNDKYVHALP